MNCEVFLAAGSGMVFGLSAAVRFGRCQWDPGPMGGSFGGEGRVGRGRWSYYLRAVMRATRGGTGEGCLVIGA